MRKWFILAASCLAFSSASAQECTDPVVNTDEVSVDEAQGGDVSQPPSLYDCGCGKGKGGGKPK